MSTAVSYDSIRSQALTTGTDARVEVNQRALIDKILARYASAGAVYRELLQNSNDANATVAEIHFTVNDHQKVTQVVYQNNGMPFRPQDWSRLQKIAEGNPDVSKVGAFGVGAYTMFSICEEPMVVSGSSSCCFVWKGDALWCKTAALPPSQHSAWTTFVLPSRDLYTMPNLAEFGEFLCASLTFTNQLKHIRVLVNEKEQLSITKLLVQEPRLIQTPKGSNNSNSAAAVAWFLGSNGSQNNKGGAVTTTPQGLFSLTKPQSFLERSTSSNGKSQGPAIYESIQRITVQMHGGKQLSSMDARYVSATAHANLPRDLVARMQRVTKKDPPAVVKLELFLNATRHTSKPAHDAERIAQSFSPQSGRGRIFIGFRTSQTTGLAAHVSAPFCPTVEREAMDLQDAGLRLFNTELLEMAGILLRLTLEQGLYSLQAQWSATAAERAKLEDELLRKEHSRKELREKKLKQEKEEEEKQQAEEEETGKQGGLMGFAKFMARGVKKKIVQVVNTVEGLIEGPDLLNPSDARPLTAEEEEAIVLMQAFCPLPSTPDPLVGTCLAQGFSRCLTEQAPPVLTRTSVIPGGQARLPMHGMQAFCKDQVIRTVVYENAMEYHDVIAGCRKLSVTDLVASVKAKVMTEVEMIQLIQWLIQYQRVDASTVAKYGQLLKDVIRFIPANAPEEVVQLSNYLFFVEKNSQLETEDKLPVPETVLPKRLQDQMTSVDRLQWFTPLPMEVWAQFISQHQAMTQARVEDEKLRMSILVTLCKSYQRKNYQERVAFGALCAGILKDKRCLPFDSDEPTQYAAERPPDLYLYGADLSVFEGVGSFYKVAASLQTAGVSEDFLSVLGVRQSVSLDFLFSNLDKLNWSSDPKPLVDYLRKAKLTSQDMRQLQTAQYLPCDTDSSRLFAPSELYLPNPQLVCLPFCKQLKWPTSKTISDQSESGQFLSRLGVQYLPRLQSVLEYLTTSTELGRTKRLDCLAFVADRLAPRGAYHEDYKRISLSKRRTLKFLPCKVTSPVDDKEREYLLSPLNSYSDQGCSIMAFPVLNVDNAHRRLYGNLFACPQEPDRQERIQQLQNIVEQCKSHQKNDNITSTRVLHVMKQIFQYLSRVDFDRRSLQGLGSFIPLLVKGELVWFRSNQVFFHSEDPSLFPMVEYSPFLAAAGVQQEASTKEWLEAMLNRPQELLNEMGHDKYRTLLRRIAANPPFKQVTQRIREKAFLLAYPAATEEDKHPTPQLRKASNIFIIDNSFFGRMFNVERAPHESDLEDFYCQLGSQYISQSVERRFEVAGKPKEATPATKLLKERLAERSPLLVSPTVTTRPLTKNASTVLTSLKFLQADALMAVFSLRGATRRNATTCFSRKGHGIFVVEKFDWFDVGYAIGDLILQRCQLEDAFFISSLLEAPLEQLRARGFPVDRMIRPPPPPKVIEPPKPESKKEGTQAEPNVEKKPEKPLTRESKQSIAKDKEEAQRDFVAQNQTQTTASDAIEPAGKPAPSSSMPTSNPSPPGNVSSSQSEHTPVPDQSRGTKGLFGRSKKKQDQTEEDEKKKMQELVMQMFPDVDPEFVKSALGPNPTVNDVQSLTDQMFQGEYPTSKQNGEDDPDDATVSTEASSGTTDKPKKGLRGRLSRALGGRRGSKASVPEPAIPPRTSKSAVKQAAPSEPAVSPALPNVLAGMGGIGGMGGSGGVGVAPPSSGPRHVREESKPVSPAHDSATQNSLESMLQQTVKASRHVSKEDMESKPTTVSSSVPEGFEREEQCEYIEGKRLAAFGSTKNGIRVFSWKDLISSAAFLRDNADVVEKFSVVLQHLAEVYDLSLKSVSIFHDPLGGTIAFNANRTLHFNVRFYHSLHYSKPFSPECFSYWFVTMAHELAHHLVSAHNKEHGFYTESYTTMYIPKLLTLLKQF